MDESAYPLRKVEEMVENHDSRRIPVKASDRKPGPFPYYGAQGIVDYVRDHIFDGEFVLVAEDGENLRSRNEPIALIATGKFWVNNHAHVLKGNGKADTRFVYYAINNSDISGYVSGSTIPKLSQKSLNAISLPCPPIEEQRAIVGILGALDDKIDLNRRTNETIEATALALFRDWFVDFGPTRAKMEGRAPYLAPDLWALFPDSIDEGTDAPPNLPVEPLYDQAEWVNGAAYSKMHFSEALDALPVVKIAELKAGITESTKRTNTALGERYRIDNGELLFSWSGNPDTSIDAFIWTEGAAWLNQHIFAVRENGKHSKAALFFMLKHHMPEFAEIARNKQTTGLGHVTKADMQRMKVCTGSETIRKAFDDVGGRMFEQIVCNLSETQTLARTRDFLLPKLMSGEIRLRDAERAAGEAL